LSPKYSRAAPKARCSRSSKEPLASCATPSRRRAALSLQRLTSLPKGFAVASKRLARGAMRTPRMGSYKCCKPAVCDRHRSHQVACARAASVSKR
jgi:hypothetical protein